MAKAMVTFFTNLRFNLKRVKPGLRPNRCMVSSMTVIPMIFARIPIVIKNV